MFLRYLILDTTLQCLAFCEELVDGNISKTLWHPISFQTHYLTRQKKGPMEMRLQTELQNHTALLQIMKTLSLVQFLNVMLVKIFYPFPDILEKVLSVPNPKVYNLQSNVSSQMQPYLSLRMMISRDLSDQCSQSMN